MRILFFLLGIQVAWKTFNQRLQERERRRHESLWVEVCASQREQLCFKTTDFLTSFSPSDSPLWNEPQIPQLQILALTLRDWTTISALCCLHSHQSHEYSTWVTASLDATGSSLRADMHLLRESTTLFGIFTPPYLQNTIFFFRSFLSWILLFLKHVHRKQGISLTVI